MYKVGRFSSLGIVVCVCVCVCVRVHVRKSKESHMMTSTGVCIDLEMSECVRG